MASTRPPGTYSPSARTGRSGGGAGGVAGMVRHAGPDALPTVPVDSWAASIRRWSRPDTAFRFRGCFDIGNPLQHNPRPRGPGRTGCAHGSGGSASVSDRADGVRVRATLHVSAHAHQTCTPFRGFSHPYPLTKGRGDVDFGARVADATALRRLDAEGDGRHRAVAPRPGPRFRNPSRGCRCTSATPRWRRSAPRPRRRHRPPRCRGPAGVSGEPEATNVGCCHANTVHPMAELNPALLLIRIGGESGEPGVLDGPTHREMVEVLVGEVLEAKNTMHGVVEVTPDTSAPNPGSFGF